MALEKEIEFYKKSLETWLSHYEGKFALIKSQELLGTYTKMEEAYEEGVQRFGKEPFLIKLIAKEEPTEQLPVFFFGLSNAHVQ